LRAACCLALMLRCMRLRFCLLFELAIVVVLCLRRTPSGRRGCSMYECAPSNTRDARLMQARPTLATLAGERGRGRARCRRRSRRRSRPRPRPRPRTTPAPPGASTSELLSLSYWIRLFCSFSRPDI
jgi:hypothetical protein